MPLNSALLGNEIMAAIDGVTDKTDRAALFQAMAQAIVAHVVANAQVSVAVTVTSVSGVTPGAGVSGPGTGTGTGSIT